MFTGLMVDGLPFYSHAASPSYQVLSLAVFVYSLRGYSLSYFSDFDNSVDRFKDAVWPDLICMRVVPLDRHNPL